MSHAIAPGVASVVGDRFDCVVGATVDVDTGLVMAELAVVAEPRLAELRSADNCEACGL